MKCTSSSHNPTYIHPFSYNPIKTITLTKYKVSVRNIKIP